MVARAMAESKRKQKQWKEAKGPVFPEDPPWKRVRREAQETQRRRNWEQPPPVFPFPFEIEPEQEKMPAPVAEVKPDQEREILPERLPEGKGTEGTVQTEGSLQRVPKGPAYGQPLVSMVQEKERSKPFILGKHDLVYGIIMSEVLQPPRAKRPYRPFHWRMTRGT